MNIVWQYYNEILRRIWFSPISRRIEAVPRDRLPGDTFLKMDMDHAFVGASFILAFSCIFLLAWNSHFPSTFERVSWRTASIYMMAYGLVGLLDMGMWMFVVKPRKRLAAECKLSLFEESIQNENQGYILVQPRQTQVHHSRDRADNNSKRKRASKLQSWFFRNHNISPDHDPRLGVPIGLLIPTTVLCVFYCIFRFYILTEDVIALRSLPTDAYATVDWLTFIPHL